ncbi:MAG TPA: desulfoferrodoxin [Spirochaetia bacterium]|nr:desulfoferrodoxin [Spirochaetia bacterium]
MTELSQIYRCRVCGNMAEMVHAGAGSMVCCGETMELLVEKNSDTGMEKHVPVIEKGGSTITVKVGSIPHPMEEKHYIAIIELLADGKVYRQFQTPGDEPKAVFCLQADQVSAREWCTIHGLWKS